MLGFFRRPRYVRPFLTVESGHKSSGQKWLGLDRFPPECWAKQDDPP